VANRTRRGAANSSMCLSYPPGVRQGGAVSDERTFVIVGAAQAGARAAEALRSEGYTGRLVLVGQEQELPYERPPLSKGYLLGIEPRESGLVQEAAWYTDQNVELRLGVEATGLDPDAHTVTLDSGERLSYDRLLLATGSVVRTLSLPGSDADGVRYLRRIGDSEELIARVGPGTDVVVVGAGWIGLEVAAAARTRGATVHVVESDSLPLRRVLGPELGAMYADLHRAHGVQFHFDSGLRSFGTADGKLAHVVLNDGTELPAQVAVVGVGVRPATDLAERAGLAVENGVLVDASLCTSAPDIFACGDVASWPSSLTGARLRVEHWENALAGSQIVAKAMLGQAASYADHVPYFYSDQYVSPGQEPPGIGMEYCGYTALGAYDRVVFRGDPTITPERNPEFIAFWLKEDRVLAAMNANIWDVQDYLAPLVRAGFAGRAVDPDRLVDPSVDLAELLA
jgi:3-phenylpropionate/trans-cinnamate dioxygenase ferredoxin reductase subunit